MIKTIVILTILLEMILCQSTSPMVCTTDTHLCSDGTYVARDPNNNCTFTPCPNGTVSTNSTSVNATLSTSTSTSPSVNVTVNATISSTPSVSSNQTSTSTSASPSYSTMGICTTDAYLCPDGTYVGRDPNNNCQFTPCPTVNVSTSNTTTFYNQSFIMLEPYFTFILNPTNLSFTEFGHTQNMTLDLRLTESMNGTFFDLTGFNNSVIITFLFNFTEQSFTGSYSIYALNGTFYGDYSKSNSFTEGIGSFDIFNVTLWLLSVNSTSSSTTTIHESFDLTIGWNQYNQSLSELASINETVSVAIIWREITTVNISTSVNTSISTSISTSSNETSISTSSNETSISTSSNETSISTSATSSNESLSTQSSSPVTCILTTVPSETALSTSQLNSSCVYGTLLFNGHCACWSGAFGKNCEMGSAHCQLIIYRPWNNTLDQGVSNVYGSDLDESNINRDFCMNFVNHPTCTSYQSWGVVQALNTLNPPNLDSALFDFNYINITVSQPMVNGRADGAVFLNQLNNSNTNCVYPISDYIHKEVDGCRDLWIFSIPWNIASQCGWLIQDIESYREYRGQVIVQNHEWLTNIYEFRLIQSVLRIRIRFQVFIQVTLSSAVYNQPNLQAAITEQIVSVTLGGCNAIQLTTVVNYPYELSNGDLILTPPGLVNHSYLSSSFISCSGLEECKQRWTATLCLTNNSCTLNGAYRMNFTETCRSGNDIECPLGNDVAATFDFNLVSENFCAEIDIDIGLYGNIQVYSDETFTNTQSAFIIGNRACLLVTLYSELNGQQSSTSNAAIFLNSTRLYSLTLRVQGTNDIIRLYSNGSLSNSNYSSSLTEINRPQGNVAGFCFDFSQNIITNLNCTGVAQIVIGVSVMVDYTTLGSNSTSTKRDIFNFEDASNSGQQSTTLSTTTSVDTSKSQTTSNNNNNDGAVIIASLVFMLLAMII